MGKKQRYHEKSKDSMQTANIPTRKIKYYTRLRFEVFSLERLWTLDCPPPTGDRVSCGS